MLNLTSVDRHGGETVHLQVARAIRRQIADGDLQLGERLPSAREALAEYQIGRYVYQRAVERLRLEGLVVVRVGLGAFVAARPRLQVVDLRPGDELDFRAPDDAERERLGMERLTAVAVVTRADGGEEVYSQGTTRFRVADIP
jgi:DNA-binding FadR family transcriptional regulator